MRTLKGNGRITDINVAATVKEIRRALMDADVNYKVAKEITKISALSSTDIVLVPAL